MTRGPVGPAALLARGLGAFRAAQYPAAAQLLTMVLQQTPDPRLRSEAIKHLGLSLQRLGGYAQAVDVLRQAEAQTRGDPEVLVALALSLRHLDRAPEAIEACRRCLKSHPDHSDAITLQVELLIRQQRAEEARSLIEQADRRGLVNPYVDLGFSTLALKDAERMEEAIARLSRHADDQSHPALVRSEVLHATGDLLDKLGRYDEAWAAHEKANRARGLTFEPERYERSCEDATRLWSGEVIERLRAGASEDERPVLIVGMPRSGTTLVELIAGAHPAVHACGEIMALTDVWRLIQARVGEGTWSTLDPVQPAHVAEGALEYARVLDRIAPGSARATNKLPMNVLLLGLFAAMYPNGRVVHCRRDPRDVCLSCFFRGFLYPNAYSTRPDWLAAYYRGYVTLVEHWARVFPTLTRPVRVHEVSYHELVADHEAHARALIEFLGLAWDPACAKVGGDARTLRADQAGKGVYTSSVGRYQNYARHVGAWADLRAPSLSGRA